jgi:flagellar basal-body rod protein FlgB
MDSSRIGLFDLAEKRLTWAAARQTVLASNIANANTPGYKARDVESFQSMLAGYGGLAPVQTQPMHLSGTIPTSSVGQVTGQPSVRSIDGNGVTLDQQLTKVADTETTESMVTTIWKKYMSFFSMALGRSS